MHISSGMESQTTDEVIPIYFIVLPSLEFTSEWMCISVWMCSQMQGTGDEQYKPAICVETKVTVDFIQS